MLKQKKVENIKKYQGWHQRLNEEAIIPNIRSGVKNPLEAENAKAAR